VLNKLYDKKICCVHLDFRFNDARLAQWTIDGKSSKIRVANAREVHCRKPGAALRAAGA
jgi:hypothetical protein